MDVYKSVRSVVALLSISLFASPLHAEESKDNQVLSQYSAISADDLESTRGLGGGTDFLQFNDMKLNATMSDNVIKSNSSGNNAITHGAFTENGGFATVIQNSGSHVIIQNATIVNLTMGE